MDSVTHVARVGRILTICTGNICRSPVAELLLRASLTPPFEVASAGTFGVVGHPVEPAMARLLLAGGADPRLVDGFAGRRLGEPDVAAADLVLGLAAEHRTAAVQAHPGGLRRSFTLLEFAALVEPLPAVVAGAAYATPAQRLRAVVAAADGLRRDRAVRLPDDLDIADPYGRGDTAYERAYAAIRTAVAVVATALAGP